MVNLDIFAASKKTSADTLGRQVGAIAALLFELLSAMRKNKHYLSRLPNPRSAVCCLELAAMGANFI